jgi:NAD(P)-dependent dehydrogenase (short-subunit alcohol dehydrogenase family)
MDRDELFGLDGRTILVTGGTKGIGVCLVQRLAERGATVIAVARNAHDLAAVQQRFGCQIIAADISRRDECQRLAETLDAQASRLDGLILNAAYDPPHFGPLGKIPEEQLEKAIDTNIKSAIWLTGRLCPGMAARGGGSIVFILSAAAFRGSNNYAAYSMTKLAGHSLVQSLAAEWAPRNVRVNGIAPSIVRTELSVHLVENASRYSQLIKNYPLRRIGEPDDVAGIAIMMLSRAGSWVTGQTLVVDGGMAAAAGCFYDD